MSELRLHLDEDAEAHALVIALRERGVDVTTTGEASLSETSDEAQLAWAIQQGRAVLTYSKPHCVAARKRLCIAADDRPEDHR